MGLLSQIGGSVNSVTSPSATEDYEDLARRMKLLKVIDRRLCIRNHGGRPEECWCWQAGSNGMHIPCSEAADYVAPIPEQAQ